MRLIEIKHAVFVEIKRQRVKINENGEHVDNGVEILGSIDQICSQIAYRDCDATIQMVKAVAEHGDKITDYFFCNHLIETLVVGCSLVGDMPNVLGKILQEVSLDETDYPCKHMDENMNIDASTNEVKPANKDLRPTNQVVKGYKELVRLRDSTSRQSDYDLLRSWASQIVDELECRGYDTSQLPD